MNAEFRELFQSWAEAASQTWGIGPPTEDYFAAVGKKIAPDVQFLVLEGLKEGLVKSTGEWRFRLPSLGRGKGPYQWFSKKREGLGGPGPNWEYFVQVAEFVRLSRLLKPPKWRLGFEDHDMDVTVYAGPKLMAYLEAKADRKKAEELIPDTQKWEDGVDWEVRDRGKDGLRTAKRLIEHRPQYFCSFAGDVRFEFRVAYLGPNGFKLSPEKIPFI